MSPEGSCYGAYWGTQPQWCGEFDRGGFSVATKTICLAEKARRAGRAISEEEGRKRLKAALRRIAKKRAEAIKARHAQTVPRR